MGPLDQTLALLRWKRMILANTFIVAILAVVIALLLPKVYRSTAAVFPPEEDAFALSDLASLVSLGAAGRSQARLPIWATPSDVYAAILKSRTVREEIVERFDLVRVYKQKDVDGALEVLDPVVKIKVGGEGVVSIQVFDKDPQRAADMANAFVASLDRMNRERRHSSARQARVFLDARLTENRTELAAAEERLRTIQETTGVLIPEEQLKAVLAAAADVQLDLVRKEVELEVLQARVGPQHPDRAALEREVRVLRRKVEALDLGPDGGAGPASGGVAVSADPGLLEIPLREYPGRNLEFVRAYRELRVQEGLYQYLVQQRESYRVQENRDTPTVQVLDTAVPATKKAKPKRSILVLAATFGAFLISVLAATGFEAVARLRRTDPEAYGRVERIAGELRLRRLLERI